MDSKEEVTQFATTKPLGQLGRDEMNLAEFPITLLTDRVPKDQTEAIYQDEIYDDRTGRTLTRRLTIKAGGYGLTKAADDEVILALIQLTRQKNNFNRRRVEFSRHELIQMLNWPSHGTSYERILLPSNDGPASICNTKTPGVITKQRRGPRLKASTSSTILNSMTAATLVSNLIYSNHILFGTK